MCAFLDMQKKIQSQKWTCFPNIHDFEFNIGLFREQIFIAICVAWISYIQPDVSGIALNNLC
jgi:hypothetical protein